MLCHVFMFMFVFVYMYTLDMTIDGTQDAQVNTHARAQMVYIATCFPLSSHNCEDDEEVSGRGGQQAQDKAGP